MWLINLQLESLLPMIAFVLMLLGLAKLAYGGAR
jgi:hypothetical protein